MDAAVTSDNSAASAIGPTSGPQRLAADSRDESPEIIRLPIHPADADSTTADSVPAAWARERRRLQQAVELLRRARQKLHEQSLQNEQQQQRLLSAIREEWRNRRRQLERQLAVTALQHARAELAAEWEQLHLERQRWVEQKALHRRRDADHEQQQAALQDQLTEARRKLASAELELVRNQVAWAEDKRRWNAERAEAERIIGDLLEETEARPHPLTAARAA